MVVQRQVRWIDDDDGDAQYRHGHCMLVRHRYGGVMIYLFYLSDMRTVMYLRWLTVRYVGMMMMMMNLGA